MSNEYADPGHGHSPAAWIAVTIMLLGFAIGAVFFWFANMTGIWISICIIVLGLISGFVLAKAGWGQHGPKYQPKGH